METKVAEIAPKIYRLSSFVPDLAPPAGDCADALNALADFYAGRLADVL